MIDFTASLEAKGFYRFTGPPEHWLTGIKFMTWGLEQKYLDRWKEIQVGDIFFIHSTGHSEFPNAKSGIIGLGVVGPDFSTKKDFLWLSELKEKTNKWPLLVPFSELYLFSQLPETNSWEAPNLRNGEQTKKLIDLLLRDAIPLGKIPHFPQMGSFSGVSKEVALRILSDNKPLIAYSNIKPTSYVNAKPTELVEVKDVSETLRYAETLKPFKEIKSRIIREDKVTYEKDNELLARADSIHASIVQQLIDIFRKKGYETLNNRLVDLFAYRDDKSFLFEVKSTERDNFRDQARKGIVQLFEYDYFEINKFIKDKQIELNHYNKILIPSRSPKDQKYIDFINHVKIGVATISQDNLKAIGQDFNISSA